MLEGPIEIELEGATEGAKEEPLSLVLFLGVLLPSLALRTFLLLPLKEELEVLLPASSSKCEALPFSSRGLSATLVTDTLASPTEASLEPMLFRGVLLVLLAVPHTPSSVFGGWGGSSM